MKSVLISIQPKWCELIANGSKPIEVRKTKPKIDGAFKCYIYCTKPKRYFSVGMHTNSSNEYLHLCENKVTMGDGFDLWDKEYAVLNGKVIGEFVCDEIYTGKAETKEEAMSLYYDIAEQSCLSEHEFVDYWNGKDLYAWHISDLKIYNKPKELSDFKKPTMPTGLEYENNIIEKAPQSWGYVEEV